jgi:hypothetical protein
MLQSELRLWKREKVKLLLAICGDDVGRIRWHAQFMDEGTTTEMFYDGTMTDIEQNHPGRQFVITMDNLSAHKNPLVTN